MYNAYTKVEIPEAEKAFGTGWLLPLPGLQEYTEKHPDIQATEKKLGISGAKKALPSLTSKMDLRKWC